MSQDEYMLMTKLDGTAEQKAAILAEKPLQVSISNFNISKTFVSRMSIVPIYFIFYYLHHTERSCRFQVPLHQRKTVAYVFLSGPCLSQQDILSCL